MELNKILFIAPDSEVTNNKSFPISPSVLAYLAAMVPPEIEVELIDMGRREVDYNADVELVCISCMTPMAVRGEMVAREFRKRGVKVAIGGHHPTVLPLEVKEYADIVFVGEAEETFPRMLKDFERDELRDFYVCGKWKHIGSLPGKTYTIENRPDLKNIPIPRKKLIKHKYPFDTIQTTRGCPFACDFCSVTEFFGGKIRKRPLDEVEKEIETLSNTFFLLDDNCFSIPTYNMEFYKLLIKNKKKRKWLAQGSLSIVNHPRCDEILYLAAKSGLRFLMVGIESLDKDNLKENNIAKKLGHKGEPDINFTKEAIKKIESYGIVVWGFMIFGFMDDKLDIFEKAYKFINATKIVPCPAVVNPLPETKLYKRVKDYIIPSRGWDSCSGPLATYYINNYTPDELEQKTLELQLRSYTWKNIIIRLMHIHPKNIMLSLMIQLGMRSIFKDYCRRLKFFQLPQSEQLLAKDIRQQKKLLVS